MSSKICNVCATTAPGIPWKHINQPKMLVHSVYRFHVVFHMRIILHNLGISLPTEDGFSKVKNCYITSACMLYSICVDYGVNTEET